MKVTRRIGRFDKNGRSVLCCLLLMAVTMACNKTHPSIYKKWIIVEDGQQIVVDLLDHVHFEKYRTYSPEFCKKVHDSYTPGVFYLVDHRQCWVKMDGRDAGSVCSHFNGQDTVLCTFSHLTQQSVTFKFPDKGEAQAIGTKKSIQVVNPNSEEINVDDLMDVYDNYLMRPDILKDICQKQGLRLISKKKAASTADYTHEIWGRGVMLKAWLFCSKTADDALALGYLFKRGRGGARPEYAEAAISFTNPRLLKVYEQQMARQGYFRQNDGQTTGSYEVIFAPDRWVESTEHPIFTLVDDKSGIYYLSFGE